MGDEKKFESSDVPKVGDVFLWRYNEKKKNGDTESHGHTGIVESIDEDGKIHTVEAYGTKQGTIPFTRNLADFTGHKGWKGFFRPIVETPDGKFDEIEKSDKKVEKKDEKQTTTISVSVSNGQETNRTTVDANTVSSWGELWNQINRWMNW